MTVVEDLEEELDTFNMYIIERIQKYHQFADLNLLVSFYEIAKREKFFQKFMKDNYIKHTIMCMM